MPQFKTLDDIDVAGKRVLVRADLNVPMQDGRVTSAVRIERTLPTLRELRDKGARVIIMSHFGRPKGRVVAEMSLRPVADETARLLGVPVAFADDCVGPAAAATIAPLEPGDVAMLENLRFHAAETENDEAFADRLASLADIYVNDAFSCAHRAHASTEAVARRLPAVAGRLMQAELEALERALETPNHPVAAVVGGAKVSSKMDVLGHLIDRMDLVIIGGGMANTFLHAQGIDVGKSLCEHDMAALARDILARAEAAGCAVVLPVDAVCAEAFAEGADTTTVPVAAIPLQLMMLDVGPATITDLKQRLAAVKTLLWNGPLGAFEVKPFDAATNAVAQEAARLTRAGALLTVAGGGDTVAALENAGASDDFSYVSTAGGAFLEWIEGKTLPGVKALEDAT